MAEATYIHGTEQEEQERLARLNRLTNAPFLAWLELRPTDRVLEVGSGLGLLAREVAARTPQGEVIGIEYADAQLARAPRDVPSLRFLQGDAHHLPFAEAQFDVVYCRYVLEHVADPALVLREMRRVLKPGGRVYALENDIVVTRWDPDCPRFDALWRQFVALQAQLGGDGLIGKKLFRLFRQADFREITLSLQPEVHCAGQEGFVAWVENILGNVAGAAAKLVEHGLTTEAEIAAACDELRSLLACEDATALFYWNRATGVK